MIPNSSNKAEGKKKKIDQFSGVTLYGNQDNYWSNMVVVDRFNVELEVSWCLLQIVCLHPNAEFGRHTITVLILHDLNPPKFLSFPALVARRPMREMGNFILQHILARTICRHTLNCLPSHRRDKRFFFPPPRPQVLTGVNSD